MKKTVLSLLLAVIMIASLLAGGAAMTTSAKANGDPNTIAPNQISLNPNVARGKTAWAADPSTEQSEFPAAFVVDGVATTKNSSIQYWHPNKTNAVIIDLGGSFLIDEIALIPFQPGTPSGYIDQQTFQLQYSNDGQTWLDFDREEYEQSNTGETMGSLWFYMRPETPKTANYIRFLVTGMIPRTNDGASGGARLGEIEVYGAPLGCVFCQEIGSHNSCSGCGSACNRADGYIHDVCPFCFGLCDGETGVVHDPCPICGGVCEGSGDDGEHIARETYLDENNNILLRIEADKTDYEIDEPINMMVTATNTNDFAVFNVDLALLLTDTFTLLTDNAEKSKVSLAAGETMVLQLQAALQSEPPDPGASSENPASDVSSEPPATSNLTPGTTSTTPQGTDDPITPSPKTGDHANILVCAIFCGMLGLLIGGIALFKNKKLVRTLSVFLVVLSVFGLGLSFPAAAETDLRIDASVDLTVTVDGEIYTLTAKACLDTPEDPVYMTRSFPRNCISGTYAALIDGQQRTFPYKLYVPAGPKTKEPYPVILFLHGSGERGTNNTAPTNTNVSLLSQLTDSYAAKYPCIFLVPQCPVDLWWEHDDMTEMLMGLTEEIQDAYNADKDRLYIMGFSSGAFGTWSMVGRYPDKIAAAVPMAGGFYPFPHYSDLRNCIDVPIWNFHGELDEAVDVEHSRRLEELLNGWGGNVKYTEFPGVFHGCVMRVYSEPELIPWIFAQTTKGRIPKDKNIPTYWDDLYRVFNGMPGYWEDYLNIYYKFWQE